MNRKGTVVVKTTRVIFATNDATSTYEDLGGHVYDMEGIREYLSQIYGEVTLKAIVQNEYTICTDLPTLVARVMETNESSVYLKCINTFDFT